MLGAVFLIIALGCGALWLTQLMDLLEKRDDDFPSPNDRLIWVLVILFVPVIGAGLYWLGRPRPAVQSSRALRRDWAAIAAARDAERQSNPNP